MNSLTSIKISYCIFNLLQEFKLQILFTIVASFPQDVSHVLEDPPTYTKANSVDYHRIIIVIRVTIWSY